MVRTKRTLENDDAVAIFVNDVLTSARDWANHSNRQISNNYPAASEMDDSGQQKLASVKTDYWTERWKNKETRWHKDFVDEMLKVHRGGSWTSRPNVCLNTSQTTLFVFHLWCAEILLFFVRRGREPSGAFGVCSALWEVGGLGVALRSRNERRRK